MAARRELRQGSTVTVPGMPSVILKAIAAVGMAVLPRPGRSLLALSVREHERADHRTRENDLWRAIGPNQTRCCELHVKAPV